MSKTTAPPQRNFRNKSFFETTIKELESHSSPQFLPLSDISLPPSQPRKYFDPYSLNQLAYSIKRDGILQPLLVRPLDDGKYELVAGERRYRVAKQLELDSVPVLIKSLTVQEAKLISLTENLQREDLNPVEETEAVLDLLSLKFNLNTTEVTSLLNRFKDEEKGKIKSQINLPHNDVGKTEIEDFFAPLGLTWQSILSHRIPLLRLPDDIKVKLREGKIAYTKASAIAKIKSPLMRESLLEEAITKGLSLSQIKEKIKELTESPQFNEQEFTPKDEITSVYKKLKTSKVWEDSRKWKKIQGWLRKVENILEE